MSIIAAFVSGEAGLVASDGRIFTPAIFNSKRVLKQAEIEQNDFDKTFNFNNYIIGAFCGLIRFNGLTTSNHIIEILSTITEPAGNFENTCHTFGDNFRARLLSISPDEVLFNFRTVDILLVRRISKKVMGVVKMRFLPNHSDICIESNLSNIKKDTNRYFLFGNDRAQKGAINVFTANTAKNHDSNFLSKLITKAIQAGITSSGQNKFSPEKECGGIIFKKQID